MTRLITIGVWARITKAAKATPTRAHVAVAYFGRGASRLLPLRAGSTLVVDMSMSAVKSGQTNPGEVLKLIERGVTVYSVPNLHAKVFVFGKRAFVGSSNVSQSSATGLVEAVVETTSLAVVNAAKRFVRDQSFRMVTPEYARTMAKLYKPPKFGVSRQSREEQGIPQTPVVHVVQLVYENWSEDEDRFDEQQTKIAKGLRKRPRSSVVEKFRWKGQCSIQKEDLVIQVTDEGHGRKMISPQGSVLHVRRYRKSGRHVWFVYVELPTGHRRKALKSVAERLGRPLGKMMTRNTTVRRASLVRTLLRLWS